MHVFSFVKQYYTVFPDEDDEFQKTISLLQEPGQCVEDIRKLVTKMKRFMRDTNDDRQAV